MRPRQCAVCKCSSPKYACASCRVASYCSVACYTQHKETCTAVATATPPAPTLVCAHHTPQSSTPTDDTEPLQEPPPLRPLTTLKWPYVPDVSAYPDPLTRDDPKPLRLDQYEALATSPAIRTVLRSNPRLCDLLASVNVLRGAEREEALQRALGVDSRQLKNDDAGEPLDEDTRAFREFSEAVEAAVRGGQEGALGLDWG